MKALRKLMAGLMAILMVAGLSSCREEVYYNEDEVIGFDISGMYGKLWEADLGESVYEGGFEWPIYSEFEFVSGTYSDAGVGTETRRYADNDQIYEVLHFNWVVDCGDLRLDYGYDGVMWFYDLATRPNIFSAYVEDDPYRTDFYLLRTRATGSDSTKVVNTRKIEGPIQFKAKAK